jgi:hypothetical protein
MAMRPLGDDPRHLSWQAISALAWWRLNRSGELSPPVGHGRDFHGRPRLRLWDDAMGLGGGSEPMTLTVFRPIFSETGAPMVREAIWQRSVDLDRLSEEIRGAKDVVAFRPTITVRDAPVPNDRFATLMEVASTFHLPVVWFGDREANALDVGSVGLEVFGDSQPPAVLRLEWSFEKPASWEPVIAWHGEVRRFLEGCLATKGAPPSPSGMERHPLWDQEMDGRTSGP